MWLFEENVFAIDGKQLEKSHFSKKVQATAPLLLSFRKLKGCLQLMIRPLHTCRDEITNEHHSKGYSMCYLEFI